MRKLIPIIVVMAVAGAGLAFYSRRDGAPQVGQGATAAAPAAGAQRGTGGGMPGGMPGMGGFGGGMGGFRPPMTVDTAAVTRAPVAEFVTIVGNLIGLATVQVVPKVSGRLESIAVRLADPVRRGQRIAKIEDQEVEQQVKQAQASYEVAGATIRQREADLKFAETNLERTRSLFTRQLMPRQSLDDAEARHQAAAAQLDLARAQFSQAKARLDELQITLANTEIVSPVNGFVGKRFLDPGAFASQNSPIVSVVDISTVRLIVNLVEKDVKRVTAGVPAEVEVDAYPGEQFNGRVSRVAPVFDPATRTAEMEIEIPNPTMRLKPGMYARVRLRVAERADALTVPLNALVEFDGRKGVFVPREDTAKFMPVETGLQDATHVEILKGLEEKATVISTGAAGLKDGDRIVLAGQPDGPAPGSQAPAGPGRRPGATGGPGSAGGGRPTGTGQNRPPQQPGSTR
jgi:RND family efflux transporter MFP subunit